MAFENLFIRGYSIRRDEIREEDGAYLLGLPVLQSDVQLGFHSPVAFFVGENGSGKSTLLEALAVSCGFNPEGGSRNFRFSTSDTHSPLCRHMTVIRGSRRPKDGFFLRAESFYNVATEIDRLDRENPLLPSLLERYGGKSLHRQSHGESFLSLVLNRFGGDGLYFLDEPEAALSPSRQLTLLAQIGALARKGSQFIIATHSPILMAYPGAEIYVLNEKGAARTDYRQTEHYQITKQFLENPARMLEILRKE